MPCAVTLESSYHTIERPKMAHHYAIATVAAWRGIIHSDGIYLWPANGGTRRTKAEQVETGGGATAERVTYFLTKN